MKAQFEMDVEGNHRIIVDGNVSDSTIYTGISRLHVGGKLYIGASAYYDGTMPIEQVLEATPLPTELLHEAPSFAKELRDGLKSRKG